MQKNNIKKSIFSKIRNNFIAGVVVLIPIGITIYLTLFIIRITGKLIPKEIFEFDQELINKVKNKNKEIIEKNKTNNLNSEKSYRRKIKKK